ncbi:hypothetical protein [Acanthamoeba polyphaga mimivirus]|nr:hypothetical protein HIRU_S244 [Hirudovirus strain Sangsue]UMZ07765.1 hypothetical protein [Acanthamoeba polyphaga mimivirus]
MFHALLDLSLGQLALLGLGRDFVRLDVGQLRVNVSGNVRAPRESVVKPLVLPCLEGGSSVLKTLDALFLGLLADLNSLFATLVNDFLTSLEESCGCHDAERVRAGLVANRPTPRLHLLDSLKQLLASSRPTIDAVRVRPKAETVEDSPV